MNPSMFLKIVQDIAAKVFMNSEPSDIEFGTVETVEPLSVRVNEMILLKENQLKLLAQLPAATKEMWQKVSMTMNCRNGGTMEKCLPAG